MIFIKKFFSQQMNVASYHQVTGLKHYPQKKFQTELSENAFNHRSLKLNSFLLK